MTMKESISISISALAACMAHGREREWEPVDQPTEDLGSVTIEFSLWGSVAELWPYKKSFSVFESKHFCLVNIKLNSQCHITRCSFCRFDSGFSHLETPGTTRLLKSTKFSARLESVVIGNGRVRTIFLAGWLCGRGPSRKFCTFKYTNCAWRLRLREARIRTAKRTTGSVTMWIVMTVFEVDPDRWMGPIRPIKKFDIIGSAWAICGCWYPSRIGLLKYKISCPWSRPPLDPPLHAGMTPRAAPVEKYWQLHETASSISSVTLPTAAELHSGLMFTTANQCWSPLLSLTGSHRWEPLSQSGQHDVLTGWSSNNCWSASEFSVVSLDKFAI